MCWGTEVRLHVAQVPAWEGVMGLVETRRGTGAQGSVMSSRDRGRDLESPESRGGRRRGEARGELKVALSSSVWLRQSSPVGVRAELLLCSK